MKHRNKVPHLDWMVKLHFDGGTNAAGYDAKLGGISAFDKYGNPVYNVLPQNYQSIIDALNKDKSLTVNIPEVSVVAKSPFRDVKKVIPYVWQNMVLDQLGLNWKPDTGQTNEINQKTGKPTGRGSLVPNYTFESWMPSPGVAYRRMINFANKTGSKIAKNYLLSKRLGKLDDFYKSAFKGFYDQPDPIENVVNTLPQNRQNVLAAPSDYPMLQGPNPRLNLPLPKDQLLLPEKHYANLPLPDAKAGLSDVDNLISHDLVGKAMKNTAQNGLGLFVDKEGNVNEANFNNFINNVYAKNPLGSYHSHTATEKPNGLPGNIYEVIPYDRLLANSPGPGLDLHNRRDLLGHTHDVVHTALVSPVPKGSTKQELVFSALFHDIGKLTGNRKYEGLLSTYLLDQQNIGMPNNVREAIARHMSRNTRNSKNALLKATLFADVARGLSYDDAAFKFPYLEYPHDVPLTQYASGSPSQILKLQIGPWAKEHKYQSFGDWAKSKGLKTSAKDVTEQQLNDYTNDLINQHLTWIRGVNDPGVGNVAKDELNLFGGADTKEARLKSAATFTPPKQLAGRAYMFAGPNKHGLVSSKVKVDPKDHDVLYASNSAGVGLEYSGGNPNASGTGGVFEVKLPLPDGLMDIKNPAERLAKADYAIYGAQQIKTNLNPTGIYQMYVDPYRLATGRNLIKDVLDRAGVKPTFSRDWPTAIGETDKVADFNWDGPFEGKAGNTTFYPPDYNSPDGEVYSKISDHEIADANQILQDAGIKDGIRIVDTENGKKLYFPHETKRFINETYLLDDLNNIVAKRNDRNSLLGEAIDNINFLKDHKEDPEATDPHFSSLSDMASAQSDIIDANYKLVTLESLRSNLRSKRLNTFDTYGYTDQVKKIDKKISELTDLINKYSLIVNNGNRHNLPKEQQQLWDEAENANQTLNYVLHHIMSKDSKLYDLGISDKFLKVLGNSNIPLSTKLSYLNNSKYFQKLMRNIYFDRYVKLFNKDYKKVDIKKLQEDRSEALTPSNLAKQMRDSGVQPFYDSDRINSPMVITQNGDNNFISKISVNPTSPFIEPTRIHVVGGKNDKIFDTRSVRRLSDEELNDVKKVKRRHNDAGSDKKSKSRKVSHKNLASLIPLLLGSGIAASNSKRNNAD